MRKRDIFLILAALAAAAALLLTQCNHSYIATGAWGLSFRQNNTPPQGPASVQELARYNAAYLGNTQEKVIYLTFDAGYENGCTAKILDALKDHNVPAAFFLVGNYMEKNPDLVRRMVEEGHTVGNHTMHHPDMSKLTELESFSAELTQLEALFQEISGKELPKYYRPPQGTYSKDNLIMARDMGYRTVFWSLAYVDWNNDAQPTAEEAFAKLMPRIHNGAVVLLHSTSQTNAQIIHELLTKWKDLGYTFGTLDDLFNQTSGS